MLKTNHVEKVAFKTESHRPRGKDVGTFWMYQGNQVRIESLNFSLAKVKLCGGNERTFLVPIDHLT